MGLKQVRSKSLLLKLMQCEAHAPSTGVAAASTHWSEPTDLGSHKSHCSIQPTLSTVRLTHLSLSPGYGAARAPGCLTFNSTLLEDSNPKPRS